jgi:bromodomain associated protein
MASYFAPCRRGVYTYVEEVIDDVKLMVANCREYNSPDSPVVYDCDDVNKKASKFLQPLTYGERQRGSRGSKGVDATEFDLRGALQWIVSELKASEHVRPFLAPVSGKLMTKYMQVLRPAAPGVFSSHMLQCILLCFTIPQVSVSR